MWHLDSITDSFTAAAAVDSTKVVHNRAVADLIRRIIQQFEQRGLAVHRGSRLHRYAALFAADAENADDTHHKQLDLAMLEALQFEAVRRSIETAHDWQRLSTAIVQATAGNAEAILDRPDCKARSTQFELFVWACVRAAGFQATLSEPDLTIQYGGGKVIAVAAKRPRSDRKVIKNIRAACRQIANVPHDGIVALDLSFIGAMGKPIYVQRAEHYQVLSKILLDGFVHEHEQELCAAARGHNVVGILFHHSGVVRAVHDPARLVSRRWAFLQTQPPPVHPEIARLISRLQTLGRVGSLS